MQNVEVWGGVVARAELERNVCLLGKKGARSGSGDRVGWGSWARLNQGLW